MYSPRRCSSAHLPVCVQPSSQPSKLQGDAPKNRSNEGALKRREEETEAELQWRDDKLRGNLEQGRRVARAKLHQKYMDNNFFYYFRIKIKKTRTVTFFNIYMPKFYVNQQSPANFSAKFLLHHIQCSSFLNKNMLSPSFVTFVINPHLHS